MKQHPLRQQATRLSTVSGIAEQQQMQSLGERLVHELGKPQISPADIVKRARRRRELSEGRRAQRATLSGLGGPAVKYQTSKPAPKPKIKLGGHTKIPERRIGLRTGMGEGPVVHAAKPDPRKKETFVPPPRVPRVPFAEPPPRVAAPPPRLPEPIHPEPARRQWTGALYEKELTQQEGQMWRGKAEKQLQEARQRYSSSKRDTKPARVESRRQPPSAATPSRARQDRKKPQYQRTSSRSTGGVGILSGSHVNTGTQRTIHRDAQKHQLSKFSSSKATRYPGPAPSTGIPARGTKKYTEWARKEDAAIQRKRQEWAQQDDAARRKHNVTPLDNQIASIPMNRGQQDVIDQRVHDKGKRLAYDLHRRDLQAQFLERKQEISRNENDHENAVRSWERAKRQNKEMHFQRIAENAGNTTQNNTDFEKKQADIRRYQNQFEKRKERTERKLASEAAALKVQRMVLETRSKQEAARRKKEEEQRELQQAKDENKRQAQTHSDIRHVTQTVSQSPGILSGIVSGAMAGASRVISGVNQRLQHFQKSFEVPAEQRTRREYQQRQADFDRQVADAEQEATEYKRKSEQRALEKEQKSQLRHAHNMQRIHVEGIKNLQAREEAANARRERMIQQRYGGQPQRRPQQQRIVSPMDRYKMEQKQKIDQKEIDRLDRKLMESFGFSSLTELRSKVDPEGLARNREHFARKQFPEKGQTYQRTVALGRK